MRRYGIIAVTVFGLILIAICAAAQSEKKHQVVVSKGMDKTEATQLQRTLQQDGYGPVDMVLKDGKYSIVIPVPGADKEAQALLSDLKSNGYSPEGTEVVDAASAGSAVVNSAPKGEVYRCLIYEMDTKEEAERAKQSLLADDYSAVDVVQEGNKFRVYMGLLSNEEEANKYVQSLKNDGYSGAQIVTVQDAALGTPTENLTPDQFTLPAELAKNLTAEEQALAKQIIAARSKVEGGSATAREIDELRRQIQALSKDVKDVVVTVTEGEAQKRERQKKLTQVFRRFEQQLLARNWASATELITQAREISPDDPLVDWRENQLRSAQGKAEAAGSGPETRNADEALKLSGLINEAKDLQARKRYSEAIDRYMQIYRLDPNNTEAKDKVTELTRLIDQEKQGGSSSGSATSFQNNPILWYGLGIAVGAVILFVVVLMLFMRRERQLIRKVEDLATQAIDARSASGFGPPILTESNAGTPASTEKKKGRKEKPTKTDGTPQESPAVPALGSSSLFGGSMLGGSPLDFDEPREEEKEEEPSSFVEVAEAEDHRMEKAPEGEPDMVFISGVHNQTPPEYMRPTETINEAETLNLSDMNFPLPDFGNTPLVGQETDSMAPPTFSPPPATGEINFEDLLKQPFPGARDDIEEPLMARIEDIAPPVHHPKSESVETTGFSETVAGMGAAGFAVGGLSGPAFDISAPPDFAPPPPAGASPHAAAQVSGGNGAYFHQSFDEEPVGKQPIGWQGDYDYATLQIDDKAVHNGSTHCLRFEKRSGAGSANYVCKFPNASGHVVIEFDLRCDDKNKYLLGFYIEKDEDFKQSVHTIVHRTDSKSQPSLRIQGEPIPYELGTWRHIKYDLQLLTGFVNAYVDEKHVVKDAKLATTPAYVNTLSIRDNLATTGLLYLDNIKIYKG